MNSPTIRRHRAGQFAGGAVLVVVSALTAIPAWAGPSGGTSTDSGTDPNLSQVINAAEPIVHGNHVITTGHVDMGPKFDKDGWKFLIHDDAARANAGGRTVWRYPAETVLQVVDAAKLTVPEGKTYSFVGAKPGARVWVVPQTQNPKVVWVGWNTQDPTVMAKIDRGATFSVDGVQGPGIMTVYLQSGDFGAPQVLWDSRKTGDQPVFVDTNTHTHANWVFTEPGVYLVRMKSTATLVDGSTASDTELLRFAVGSSTATQDAFSAAWKGAAVDTTPPPGSSTAVPAVSGASAIQSAAPTIAIVAIAVVAAVLIAGAAVVILRGNQAKKRALAARRRPAEDEGDAL